MFATALRGATTAELIDALEDPEPFVRELAATLLGLGGDASPPILDALRFASIPAVEVHLSNPVAREPFRRRSRIASACVAKVSGFRGDSYVLGTLGLIGYLRSRLGGDS